VSAAALAVVLVPALGIAWSPVPLEAAIAMLRTERGRSLGALFVVGYVAALALLAYLALLVAGVGHYRPGSPTYSRVGWLEVLLGLFLWGQVWRRWRLRPSSGEPDQPPVWVGQIAEFTGLRTIGVATGLAIANPKNVVLTAVAMIGVAALPTGSGTAYLAYVVLSCSALALLVIADLPAPQRVGPRLDMLRQWLGDHNTAIAITSLIVLGGVVLSRGLDALAR